MPTYHYRCSNCRAELDIQQRISEPALTACPNCETDGLKRVIGLGGGFVLKGAGFYNTDYKNSNGAKTETKSAETKPAETKSDAATPPAPSAHTCGAGCNH
jgi:putative FmdB family regulatory protein